MSAARTKPHQRAVMATDSEWARVSEAAAAAGMEKSRYVIHRTLAPESLPPEVMRRAIRQSLVLAVLEERVLRDAGAGDEWDAACTAPPVPDVPSPVVLTDQPRALRPRQPRDLRHKTTHDPLVRLAQPGVAQPPQGPRHELVRPPPVGEAKVNRLAAGHEIANLVYGPHPFRLMSHGT